MISVKLIKNDEDYKKVLNRIDAIFDTEPNTQEGEELELLVTLVELYEKETYPIRENYQCNNGGRKSFSPDEIKEIEDLLKNHKEISLRKIAQMYETGITTIQNINSGSIIKYRNENKKYPLRKTTPVSTIRV